MVISKRANNIRLEDEKITYEISAMLRRVVADEDYSYICLNTGEEYEIDITQVQECIGGIGASVTIQVSLYFSGKMKIKYLGEYFNKCDEDYIGCKCMCG